MKYSITVLQAEVTRFENGLIEANERIKEVKVLIEKKEIKGGNANTLLLSHKASINYYEKQIKELKADIAKL